MSSALIFTRCWFDNKKTVQSSFEREITRVHSKFFASMEQCDGNTETESQFAVLNE